VDLSNVCGDELHVLLREAAIAGPTALDEASGATYVMRHADVERLAHDRRVAGIGLVLFDLCGVPDGELRRWYGRLMFTNEGEAHNRLRSLVSRAFTPRAVNELRAVAGSLAADAVGSVRNDGGGDLVETFALLPMHVMCRLLGVPAEDVEVFGGWADTLSPIFGLLEPAQITAAEDAIAKLRSYVIELAERRVHDPGDDLISALLAAEHEGGRLSRDEVVDMVANLLVGGHDTTASQLGCTMITLVRHPDAAARVLGQPELVAPTVSEALRFEPSIPVVPRTALEPVEVGEEVLPAGAVLFLSTAAANREAGIWKDAEVFDVARFADPSSTPRVLSFGAGAHYCLGAALARLTLEEAVRAVVALGPLDPAEDPWSVPWRQVLGRSPERLPVLVR
jgi:cytochrome P450